MALGNTAVRILVSIFAIPALVLLSYFGGVYFLSLVLIPGGCYRSTSLPMFLTRL